MPHHKRKHEDTSDRQAKKSKHDKISKHDEEHGRKREREEKDKHHRHHKKQKVEQPTKTLSTGKELRIKKFDLKTINTNRDGKRILIVGRSGSGKSCAAVEIMRVIKDIPAWVVVSKSESGNKNYSPFVNQVVLHEDFNEDLLYRLKNRQIQLCDAWLIEGSNPKEYLSDPSVALILDDISDDAATFKQPICTWFFQVSRNFRTIMILLIQYLKTIPPALRINISHVFLYSQNSNAEIVKLFKEFGGAFKNVKEFTKVLNRCTQDHGCLVIDCMSPSTKIEDSVFHFRARKMEDQVKDPFTVGNKWAIEEYLRLYDKKWKQKHPIVELDQGPKAKKGSKKRKAPDSASSRPAPKKKQQKRIERDPVDGDESPVLLEM